MGKNGAPRNSNYPENSLTTSSESAKLEHVYAFMETRLSARGEAFMFLTCVAFLLLLISLCTWFAAEDMFFSVDNSFISCKLAFLQWEFGFAEFALNEF